MISLHPKWFGPIWRGEKTWEVRKRAPMLATPFKVYMYCTQGEEKWLAGIVGKREAYQMNGKICGEFICTGIVDYEPPWKDKVFGTCLTAKELYAYEAGCGKLSYMRIVSPRAYDTPLELKDFGLRKPPQGWCYVEEI